MAKSTIFWSDGLFESLACKIGATYRKAKTKSLGTDDRGIGMCFPNLKKIVLPNSDKKVSLFRPLHCFAGSANVSTLDTASVFAPVRIFSLDKFSQKLLKLQGRKFTGLSGMVNT